MNYWSEFGLYLKILNVLEKMCYKMVDEKSVFANNELSLRDIAVYGFDYDYTLAHYTDELNNLIYEMSLEKLIEEYSVSILATQRN